VHTHICPPPPLLPSPQEPLSLTYKSSALYVPSGPSWVTQHWLYIAAACGGGGLVLGLMFGIAAWRVAVARARMSGRHRLGRRQPSARLSVCASAWCLCEPGTCRLFVCVPAACVSLRVPVVCRRVGVRVFCNTRTGLLYIAHAQ
jgi:hypothetical protein